MRQTTSRTILQRIFGIVLFAVGFIAIVILIVFYSTSFFSDRFSSLSDFYNSFRLLFSVPLGVVVICALFFSIFFPLLFLVLLGLWLMTGKRHTNNLQAFLLVAVWILALLVGSVAVVREVAVMLSRIVPFSPDPITFRVDKGIPYDVQQTFQMTLRNAVKAKFGVPPDGYEPYMFMEMFPGLTESDFEGVQASIGSYTMQDGRLVYETDKTKLIHPAAKAVTDAGMNTLLANVSVRLGVDLSTNGTLTQIMNALVRSPDAATSTLHN